MSLFPVILTDRGTEFSLPDAIERLTGGDKLTRLFYCDARAVFRKPNVERNHENLRKALPKGSSYFMATSFDDLTQDDAALLMSHVNSYPRKANCDESPFDSFARTYGGNFVKEVFGIVRIEPDEVTLKPAGLSLLPCPVCGGKPENYTSVYTVGCADYNPATTHCIEFSNNELKVAAAAWDDFAKRCANNRITLVEYRQMKPLQNETT